MLKLKTDKSSGIYVNDMEDGDIAVVVDWTIPSIVGRIVQRYKDSLITIGMNSGEGWTNCFLQEKNEHCRVRLLEPGEELIVE